jgi:hypothetical protein
LNLLMKPSHRNAILLLGAALIFAGCGPGGQTRVQTTAPAQQQQQEVVLRYTGQPGDRDVYNTQVELIADMSQAEVPPGMEAEARKQMEGAHRLNVEMTTERELVEVQEGRLVWRERITRATAQGEGILQAGAAFVAQQEGTEAVRVYDERGRLVETREGAGAQIQEQAFAIPYPEGPVRVGETWTEQIEVGDQQVQATIRLEGFETIQGRNAARLAVTYQTEDLQVDEPLMMWVDTATGRPLRGSGTFAMTDRGVRMTMKMSIERADAQPTTP